MKKLLKKLSRGIEQATGRERSLLENLGDELITELKLKKK